jgi:glucose-1-phosphate adenylyltransferase
MTDHTFHLPEALGIVLAGGRGERLFELTENRSKPAMPLGKHLFVDFALSNIRNSKIIPRTYVLVQYKSQGIITHLANFATESQFWGRFIRTVPAQQQIGEEWYVGNANAVYQNHQLIADDPAEHVIIMAADHVYKIDLRQYLAYHLVHNADVTICGRFMPCTEVAGNFGVMELTEDMSVTGFQEKPKHPKEHPGRPGEAFGSMGIYIFRKRFLLDVLSLDHVDPRSKHDLGGDIIPRAITSSAHVRAYDHATNIIPGEHAISVREGVSYWRDVGTVDALWATNMDLVDFDPELDLYNPDWPIMTVGDHQPMFKCVNTDDYPPHGKQRYMSAGGTVFTNPDGLYKVVLGRRVHLGKNVYLSETVLLDGVTVGDGARITKAIVDEGVSIPPDCVIGESVDDDRARQIRVTENGVRVVSAHSNL